MKFNFLLIYIIGIVWFSNVNAQTKTYELDASNISASTIKLLPMQGTSPTGTVLGINNKYFLKNNQPWFPLMGEFHYNRVPSSLWESEIRKMKSAGLSIVATYIFWNEHEISPGKWDWTKNKDLRNFIEICDKNGMYVWLRIGPWCHGEQLHGGFPEWIQQMKGHRRNTPEYLAASELLFKQIARQVQGLYFGSGGPIVGIQLENEYASGEVTHVTELKKLALKADMKPVYWSVTANTVFDDSKTEVIPLQGAYPYRGWEAGGGGPTKDFLFGEDQWIMTGAFGKVYYDVNKYPRGLCEQGCGSQQTFQNRFIVEPHVVEAHLQNQIGRGMNLVGYYMFHGGTQTKSLAEPGYPVSYDFQAPISEFGLIRPSYRHLKVIHHFLNDFGNNLATMQVARPNNPITDEKDTTSLRYIARTDGKSGYLFIGNTQVRLNMPDKKVSVKIKLKDETITFPDMKIVGQSSPILPFNLIEQGLTIKYATAQPLARIQRGKHTTLFFFCLPNVEPEFKIEETGIKSIQAKNWKREQNSRKYKGGNSPVEIYGKNGARVTLIFLSREEAENSWRFNFRQKEVLMITKSDVLKIGEQLQLIQAGKNTFNLKMFPSDITRPDKFSKTGIFSTLKRSVPLINSISIPTGAEDKNAAVSIPSIESKFIKDWILSVDYQGGRCELFSENELLTDDLYNNSGPWLLSLQRYREYKTPLTIKIREWNKDISGVPEIQVNKIKKEGAKIKRVDLLPQYQIILKKTDFFE